MGEREKKTALGKHEEMSFFELKIVWHIPNHRFCIFRNKSAQSTPFKVAKNTNRVYARQYGMFQNEKLRAELC